MEVTLKDLKELLSESDTQETSTHGAIGKRCIVRTYASGVHFGEVVSVHSNDGRSRCELKNSRRIRYWKGAFTLNEMAESGLDNKESQITTQVSFHFIEDAIEFIPASDKAAKTIDEAKDYEC